MSLIETVIVIGVGLAALPLGLAGAVEGWKRVQFWRLKRQVARQYKQRKADIAAKVQADIEARARGKQILRVVNRQRGV